MKKRFITLFIAVFITSFSYAQNFRLGVTADYEAGIGDIRSYISSNIGVGVQFEYDIPLKLPQNMAFGISARLTGGMNPVNNELLSSMWNFQAIPGVYFRFYLVNNNLILQPEFGSGIQLNFPKANPNYNNTLNKMYDDQVILFAFGIRYAPKQIMDGRFEISLTPTYFICPEYDSLVQYIGVSFGLLFKI